MTKKPVSVIWVSRLLVIKITLLIVIASITIYVLFYNPERGFLKGMADALLENLTPDPYANPEYATGYVLGKYGIYCLLSGLQLIFFNTKLRTGFWVIWSLDFLILLGTGGLPIFSIIILILALNKNSRNFLRKNNTGQN